MKSCAQQNHRPQPTASSVGYHELGLWLPSPYGRGQGAGLWGLAPTPWGPSP
jgi:hypothetical protein